LFTAMSEADDFRRGILALQAGAEEAILQGDVEPRLALWSRQDPISLFGAWGMSKTGWDEVSRVFRWVASEFSDPGDSRYDFHYDIEVADVSGDLGYTVGFERFKASIGGGPPVDMSVRVTHVYRREDGEWKIVHRHGDVPAVDESPPADG
jgi:ketosteroid isomerase-like protein